MKNYGFDPSAQELHRKPTDWVFGAASSPSIADIPEDDRFLYLPQGEVQAGVEDFMDCASRGPLNKIEMELNYLYLNGLLHPENRQWLEAKGYVQQGRVTLSDRFIAIKSGTTRNGNSIVAPLDAIHRYGCIPKSLLPGNPSMTFDDYHRVSDITPAMETLGQEFSRRFQVNYEEIREEDLELALRYDCAIVALHAWPDPRNGIYQKTDAVLNHVVALPKGTYFAFDNYIDAVDGDYVKQLAPNYTFFKDKYRIFIAKQRTQSDILKDFAHEISLLQRLLDVLKRYLSYVRAS